MTVWHRNFARRESRRRCGLERLEPRLALAGDVVVSEFQAVNRSTIADQDGEFSDWIEIQNFGTDVVNLAGWYLTDDAANLTKWQFPSVQIEPGALLLTFASVRIGRPATRNYIRVSGCRRRASFWHLSSQMAQRWPAVLVPSFQHK